MCVCVCVCMYARACVYIYVSVVCVLRVFKGEKIEENLHKRKEN